MSRTLPIKPVLREADVEEVLVVPRSVKQQEIKLISGSVVLGNVAVPGGPPSPSSFLLNSVAAGSAVNQRVGSRIRMIGLEVHIEVTSEVNPTVPRYVALVYRKANLSQAAVPATDFTNSVAPFFVRRGQALTNYSVLAEWYITPGYWEGLFGPGRVEQQDLIRRRITFDLQVVYEATDNPEFGAVYVLHRLQPPADTSSARERTFCNWRIMYVDS